MDHRPNCKMQNYKTPRRQEEKTYMTLVMVDAFLDTTSEAYLYKK